jgi:hypothetical protein
MNEILIVALSSIIPLCTLIYTVIGLRHKAEVDYVARLERRLEECEKVREELQARLNHLEELIQRRTK